MKSEIRRIGADESVFVFNDKNHFAVSGYGMRSGFYLFIYLT